MHEPMCLAYNLLLAMAKELYDLPAQALYKSTKGFGHGKGAGRPHNDLNGVAIGRVH